MKKPKKLTSKNPQLLTMLQAGAVVFFQDGVTFFGDTIREYIVIKSALGITLKQTHLNKKGLIEAFDCKKKFISTTKKHIKTL